jgi:mannose-6-phosphate isomerase-like protein (cupin superfamily)
MTAAWSSRCALVNSTVAAMTTEWIVLGPGQGRSFWTSVSDATVKVNSGEADFSVFESSPPPGVPGPPPHIHRSYDEAWYIIDGQLEFAIADVTETVSAGGFAFVPRGVPHSFRNASTEPARMLVIGSPQAQAMVEELGKLVGHGPPDRDAIAALFARYDSELVAPSEP